MKDLTSDAIRKFIQNGLNGLLDTESARTITLKEIPTFLLFQDKEFKPVGAYFDIRKGLRFVPCDIKEQLTHVLALKFVDGKMTEAESSTDTELYMIQTEENIYLYATDFRLAKTVKQPLCTK